MEALNDSLFKKFYFGFNIMKDSTKTFLFFLVALAVTVPAAYLSAPDSTPFSAENMVNQALFPELREVMDAASLAICRVDKSGNPSRLEVKKVQGKWILSSFSGYPANAQNRMVEVVSALSGLEALRVMGDDANVRAQCGVLDPEDSPNAEPEEIGTRVVIRNAEGKPILDMIYGRETEEGSGKYYVRRSTQNPVYVAEFDPSKLSVKFLDWIETDLLKIQPSEITSLFALDCSLALNNAGNSGEVTPEFNHCGQFTLAQHYMESPDWELVSNLKMFGNGMREMGMPTGNALDLEMLRHVSQALADMRISSVQRKPTEIAVAFQQPENMELTPDQNRILQERGFHLLPMNLGNGVTNALFSSDGQVHVYTQDGIVYRLFFGGVAGQEAIEDIETVGERKFYRYLVLTADLYVAGIPQPKLMELPPKPAEDADATTLAQYEAQNQALIEMNQQEQRIYEERLADARQKAKERNALFADWFFIIPEDAYQQIHLTYDNTFISAEEMEKRTKAKSKSETEPTLNHEAETCTDPECPHSHKQAE